VWRRTGAWRGWRRGEGRSAAWRGKERGRFDAGAQPGWGSSRGWLDMVIGVGSVAGSQTRFADVGSDASAGASEPRPDAGLGQDVWAVALPKALSTV